MMVSEHPEDPEDVGAPKNADVMHSVKVAKSVLLKLQAIRLTLFRTGGATLPEGPRAVYQTAGVGGLVRQGDVIAVAVELLLEHLNQGKQLDGR